MHPGLVLRTGVNFLHNQNSVVGGSNLHLQHQLILHKNLLLVVNRLQFICCTFVLKNTKWSRREPLYFRKTFGRTGWAMVPKMNVPPRRGVSTVRFATTFLAPFGATEASVYRPTNKRFCTLKSPNL